MRCPSAEGVAGVQTREGLPPVGRKESAEAPASTNSSRDLFCPLCPREERAEEAAQQLADHYAALLRDARSGVGGSIRGADGHRRRRRRDGAAAHSAPLPRRPFAHRRHPRRKRVALTSSWARVRDGEGLRHFQRGPPLYPRSGHSGDTRTRLGNAEKIRVRDAT